MGETADFMQYEKSWKNMLRERESDNASEDISNDMEENSRNKYTTSYTTMYLYICMIGFLFYL